MKTATSLLSVILLTTSFSFADVHPGLKAAIDRGDVKTAKNLVEKLGVKDVYCPTGMKVDDFKKIYADTLSKSVSITKYSCDENFFIEIGQNSCKGKNELDAKICAYWTDYAPLELLLNNGSDYCNNKQSVEACNIFLKKIPFSYAGPYFTKAYKNNLFAPIFVTEEYEKDVYEDKKRTVSECRRSAESNYNSSLTSCDNSYAHKLHADAYHRQHGGRPSGNADVERTKCYRNAQSSYKRMSDACQTNPGSISVYKGRKTVKEKRKKMPLQSALYSISAQISNAAQVYNWYMFDANLLSMMDLKKKLSTKEEPWERPESYFAEEIQKRYKNNGDLESSMLLYSCLVHPNIDKTIKKNIGIELFSCKDIKKDYKSECSDAQGTKKDFFLNINKTLTATYVCDSSKWRIATDAERFTCKEGAPDSVYQINNYLYGHKVFYTCENNVPRKANEYEVETATYCTKEKQDLCIKRYICDNGEWRETSSYTECSAGACNASKYGKTYNDYMICDGNIWREMDYSERKYGLCGYQNDGQVQKEYICENNEWREANDAEMQQGLCTKEKVGTFADRHSSYETVPNGYYCSVFGWTLTTGIDTTEGVCTTDKLGQISSDYAYVCTNYGWVQIVDYKGEKLGVCNQENIGKIDSSSNEPAVCEHEVWRSFSYVENIVGKYCSINDIGKVSKVSSSRNNPGFYYVCDGKMWRYALLAELKMGFCNEKTEGQKFIRTDKKDNYWNALSYDMICQNGEWKRTQR